MTARTEANTCARPGAYPALFFDFDGTISSADVLDGLIERYSSSHAWRALEADWQSGRITTVECLAGQVGGLRASLPEMVAFAAQQEIDPGFARIVRWAEDRGIDLSILSDSFTCLIAAALEAHHLTRVTVHANDLVVEGDRAHARFPWRDPRCAVCAHCKAQHLRASTRRPRIFVGDGRSDLCAALEADVVFAKQPLALLLQERGIAYRPFVSLSEVADFLDTLTIPSVPA